MTISTGSISLDGGANWHPVSNVTFGTHTGSQPPPPYTHDTAAGPTLSDDGGSAGNWTIQPSAEEIQQRTREILDAVDRMSGWRVVRVPLEQQEHVTEPLSRPTHRRGIRLRGM